MITLGEQHAERCCDADSPLQLVEATKPEISSGTEALSKSNSSPSGESVAFDILGMSCETCAAKIERAIRAVPGVAETQVVLVTSRAQVQFEPGCANPEAVLQAVAAAGYTIDTASVSVQPDLQCSTLRSRMRSFETYLPKPLTRWVLGYPNADRVPPVESQVTVIFTDIVGFTSLAENQPAAAIADFLNDHFALVAGCIEAEGGTIDKFIGDAVMAFWVAPNTPGHKESACRAALAIGQALASANAERRTRGQPPVRLRIGIHTGPAVVGSIGSPSRMNYTIVGDTVNNAQRLEQLGKQLSDQSGCVTAIVSEAIATSLPSGFLFKPLGPVSLHGRAQSVAAYSLHTAEEIVDDFSRARI